MMQANMMPRITLFAVVAQNRVIGLRGKLLYKLPGDLPRFKDMTQGLTLVMGRKTWESLPTQPLPGRVNVVLTRNADFVAHGATVMHRVEDVLTAATDSCGLAVIGGGDVYAQFLPYADCLELTEVHDTPVGDVRFPKLDKTQWREVVRVQNAAGMLDGVAYPAFDYVTYRRV